MKTTLKPHYQVILLIFFILSGCKKDTNEIPTKTTDLNGFIQKGPFISGSSVTVYDLQSDLAPSGKTFNTVITNNNGSFSFDKISLSSQYVSLRADGFYFNEITGQQSASQITLYAIADISDEANINVNLITHLEKSRVEFLMKNGKSFKDSKTLAQKEVLSLFGISKNDIKSSEKLNIAEGGDDNSIY